MWQTLLSLSLGSLPKSLYLRFLSMVLLHQICSRNAGWTAFLLSTPITLCFANRTWSVSVKLACINMTRKQPRCTGMKIYHWKHMCWGYVCEGSFIYTFFCPLAIWRQKFDLKVLDCFISFVSVLEKQQLKQQNHDIVQKAVRFWKKKKKKLSSLIASPATFSRFVGISGGRGTAQLVVQSWDPLSFIMAQVRGGLWAEARLSPTAPGASHVCKGQTPSFAPVLTKPVACSRFSPWLSRISLAG